uniref:Uncharacterized protein n=1 Tax=Amphimedon queenslandica TaxID=400682 RepID=A0A1X7VSN1_AMPQE
TSQTGRTFLSLLPGDFDCISWCVISVQTPNRGLGLNCHTGRLRTGLI